MATSFPLSFTMLGYSGRRDGRGNVPARVVPEVAETTPPAAVSSVSASIERTGPPPSQPSQSGRGGRGGRGNVSVGVVPEVMEPSQPTASRGRGGRGGLGGRGPPVTRPTQEE